jgi:hypothetical protein
MDSSRAPLQAYLGDHSGGGGHDKPASRVPNLVRPFLSVDLLHDYSGSINLDDDPSTYLARIAGYKGNLANDFLRLEAYGLAIYFEQTILQEWSDELRTAVDDFGFVATGRYSHFFSLSMDHASGQVADPSSPPARVLQRVLSGLCQKIDPRYSPTGRPVGKGGLNRR